MRYAVLIALLLAGGCVSRPPVYMSFDLDPPVSSGLLNSIGWNALNVSNAFPGEGWTLSSGNDVSFVSSISVAKANASAIALKHAQLLFAVNKTVGYIEPDIFYSKSNRFTSFTQICREHIITSSITNEMFFAFLDALKNYNCTAAGNVDSVVIEVPGFAAVEGLNATLSRKGFVLHDAGVTKGSDLRLNFASGLRTVSIRQTKQSYPEYVNSLDLENRLSERQSIPVKERIENGNYWSNPPSGFSKAFFYCELTGTAVSISSIIAPGNALSLEEARQIGGLLC